MRSSDLRAWNSDQFVLRRGKAGQLISPLVRVGATRRAAGRRGGGGARGGPGVGWSILCTLCAAASLPACAVSVLSPFFFFFFVCDCVCVCVCVCAREQVTSQNPCGLVCTVSLGLSVPQYTHPGHGGAVDHAGQPV